MKNHGTYVTYTLGFLCSLALTLVAYSAVITRAPAGKSAVAIIIALGILQLLVQLRFFLHLGFARSMRFNLAVFAFTALIAAIVVGGSIWIMTNLNYNTMSIENSGAYMQSQEGFSADATAGMSQ